jgi:hypothetical protein
MVARECTMELVGIKSGSTMLDFLPQADQHTLPETETMRAEAIEGMTTALKSMESKRSSVGDLDFGVMLALDNLGEVLERGVSKLQLIAPHHNGRKKNIIANLTPSTRPKIKAQLQMTLPKAESQKFLDASFIEGTIEITEGKARITPTVGSPTSFSFDQKQAENVYKARHKSVKAKVDPKTHKLRDIEGTPLPWKGDFFATKTIDQLIAEQGVKPVHDLSVFGWLSDDEVDALVAEIHQGRQI